MKVRVEKLFNNCVSLRDYIVYKAIKKNQSITVDYEGNLMNLTPDELKRGKKTGKVFISKWGGPTYELIDYVWNPGQEKLL